MSETPWRHDPAFAGKFHPQQADDLQVITHDGEPRRTQRPPEACWVTVQRVHGTLRSPVGKAGGNLPLQGSDVLSQERTVYAGKLLNAPHSLTSVRQGDTVLFIHAPGLPHALMVTESYLAERPGWAFVPCDGCGADQALDPPTIMARTRFPDAPAGSVPVAFSAFCPCKGTMMLSHLGDAAPPASKSAPEASGGKPWWKFW